MSSSKPTNKHLLLRQNVAILLTIVLISGVIIYTYYYINKNQFSTYSEPLIMHIEANLNNISCHYLEEDDVLPSAEDPVFSPRRNSIFLHETSCRGGLTSRQACAVESAARAHPRRQVYVLFSAPVKNFVFRKSCLAKLRLFPNVQMARVHISEYAKKTPLQEVLARKPFANSEWWIEQTSDILRYLTLYKWGGVYLDTDMIVVKSLTPLGQNWVARPDALYVSAGAIAISMDPLGRKLVEAVLSEIKANYDPELWAMIGTETITTVVRSFCNTPNITEWCLLTCAGLEVYGPEYFYPIYYPGYEKYFRAGHLDKRTEKAYIHHFWNYMSSDTKIEKNSPYAKLAQKHCPTIFKMFGDEFGT